MSSNFEFFAQVNWQNTPDFIETQSSFANKYLVANASDSSRWIKLDDYQYRLLASIGQELRTPLHAILAVNEAIQQGVLGEISKQQLEGLKVVESSSYQVLDLIDGIVDFTRNETILENRQRSDIRNSSGVRDLEALGQPSELSSPKLAAASEIGEINCNHDLPTILFAEDNENIAGAIKLCLESRNYRVFRVGNGQSAVDKIQEVRPDIVLMDIQMPVMDGLQATQKIRAMPEFDHTPIIVLSGLIGSKDKKRCLDAGADLYLTKPCKMEALFEELRNVLAR